MQGTEPVLFLPNGEMHHVNKGVESQRLGFRIQGISGADIKGATPNRYYTTWRLYYDMYRRHPIVYSAVNKIVKVATNTGYDFVPRDSRKKISPKEYKKCQGFFEKQADFIGLLRRTYQDVLIFGNAYLEVVYDRKGRPTGFKRVAPWTIHIKADKRGKVQSYVQKDPDDPKGDVVVFKPDEMLHFKVPDPADDLYGLSPLESLKLTVTTDLNAMAWNKSYFENGAATGTMILVEEATEPEVERAREYIKEIYSGATNAHRPIILTGKMKVEKSVVSHQEMGFLAGRAQLMQEILSVLDVPPAKIGIMESANRSNSKEQDKTFRTESVTPLQYTIESVISDYFLRAILGVADTLFRHSKSDVRDAQDQMALWTDGLTHGIYNVNEVRAELGMSPIEGGDINFVMTPTGAVPVVDMELFFQLPSANVEDIPEEMHDGHGHADGPGPGLGGPRQKPTANVKPGQSPTGKAVARQFWLRAKKLADEDDGGDLQEIVADFYAAMKSDDDDERLAYLERGYAAWQLYHTEEEESLDE